MKPVKFIDSNKFSNVLNPVSSSSTPIVRPTASRSESVRFSDTSSNNWLVTLSKWIAVLAFWTLGSILFVFYSRVNAHYTPITLSQSNEVFTRYPTWLIGNYFRVRFVGYWYSHIALGIASILLGGVILIWQCGCFRVQYRESRRKFNKSRWYEYAAVLPLLNGTLAACANIQDLFLLLGCLTLTCVWGSIFYLAEEQHTRNRPTTESSTAAHKEGRRQAAVKFGIGFVIYIVHSCILLISCALNSQNPATLSETTVIVWVAYALQTFLPLSQLWTMVSYYPPEDRGHFDGYPLYDFFCTIVLYIMLLAVSVLLLVLANSE